MKMVFVDGRIILKWIFERVWITFLWLRIGSSAGLL
jgi:hypothetical protein